MSSAWRLRGYTVGELLGSGSSGDVWRAGVNGTGEHVALKRMSGVSAEQLRRAETEAALLAVLDHPHLVRLHAMVHAAEHVVLVLDLADGGSLAELLRARGRLTPGEVITAIAPVAAALAYLHDEGVVHGDVSAANILFTAAGVPLLADVGVARLTGDDSDAMSTPAYVDPSVAAGCVPGAQSDVFMLAGVALHALTGAPPWPADSAQAALALAARGVLTDVGERLAGAGVPPAMARVICRALTVDPHRRGSAADLALDLRHSGQPVAVELSAGRPRVSPVPIVHSGPRHAAVPPGLPAARPAAASGAAGSADGAGASDGAVGSGGRPAFERPALLPDGKGVAPPTRMVGPRPRPVIPRPRQRSFGPRIVVATFGVVLAALLAAAGTVWAGNRGVPRPQPHAARPDPAAGTPSALATAAGSAAATAPPRASTTAAASATVAAAAPAARSSPRPSMKRPAWAGVLDALDAVRARAYATRDAALLGEVYAEGPLLSTDAAALYRMVPVGCRLTGVRTTYTGVRATSRGAQVLVTATATLAPSRLTCHGQLQANAAGTGPTRLRLQLARTNGGTRIVALHLL